MPDLVYDEANCAKHILSNLLGLAIYLSMMFGRNTSVSSSSIFSRIFRGFTNLVRSCLKPVGTNITGTFDSLKGNPINLAIASCCETSLDLRKTLPMDFSLSLTVADSLQALCIRSDILFSGLHMYEVIYATQAHTSVMN